MTTGAVVNLVVSVPVLVSGQDLVDADGRLISNGTAVDGSVVPSLNGMEVCVIDRAGDSTLPPLGVGAYRLLVDGTPMNLEGVLPDGVNLPPSSVGATSGAKIETVANPTSSSVVTLPPPDSCSSLLLLGEVADGQLPASAVVQ